MSRKLRHEIKWIYGEGEVNIDSLLLFSMKSAKQIFDKVLQFIWKGLGINSLCLLFNSTNGDSKRK